MNPPSLDEDVSDAALPLEPGGGVVRTKEKFPWETTGEMVTSVVEPKWLSPVDSGRPLEEHHTLSHSPYVHTSLSIILCAPETLKNAEQLTHQLSHFLRIMN